MRRRESTAALQARCDRWNDLHGIGAEVVLTKDSGERVETRTESKAVVLGGHTAVVWLEGVSGCYALERVKAVRP